MKKLYHGSSTPNIKIFTPQAPNDAGDNPDNKHKGVYATDNKRWAMIMGMLAGIKNGLSSIEDKQKQKQKGIIYKGKISRKYFYLYTFDSEKFSNIPKGTNQYICFEKIKPEKVEKFLTKDYQKWIRRPNKKELKRVKHLL